jgi:hypothetical protein
MPAVPQKGSILHAKDILLSIDHIYDKFEIPQNLRMHMKKVAGVGALLCENWSGPEITETDVVAVLLIHDLGNIAKFDLSSKSSVEVMEDIGYLKELKKRITAKYGYGDHEATFNMAKELAVEKSIISLLQRMSSFSAENHTLRNREDYEIMVCVYSDLRVSPYGVVSLKERINDIIDRYAEKPIFEEFKTLPKYAPLLEEQVFKNVTISPEQINEKTVSRIASKFGSM